jgi:hypothetical protein
MGTTHFDTLSAGSLVDKNGVPVVVTGIGTAANGIPAISSTASGAQIEASVNALIALLKTMP